MRCPKCNYISFDEMEICGGCKKNISKYSQVLHGVIFKAASPDFLWFQKPEEEHEETDVLEEDAEGEIAEPEADDAEIDMGLDVDDGDSEGEGPETDNTVEFVADAEELDLDGTAADEEPQEIEFDLDSGPEAESGQKEEAQEIEFDLDDGKTEEKGLPDLSMDGLDDLDMQLEDAEESASPSVKLDKVPETKKTVKKQAAAAPKASLDLDDLDLSGLMPPAADEAHDISLDEIGELSLESSATTPSQKEKKKGSNEDDIDLLSDLSMDGLDLSAPILPPAGSAAGKKMRPTAKTGTALDSFDIDLGDLLGGNEKK